MRCESATVAMWPLRPNSSRSVRDSMMTSATSPANWMSLAPMVSSTRSRRAVGAMLARDRQRLGQRRRSARATCVEQAVLVPGLGHSVMRCEPRKPAAIVAPEQASGMKVTAMRGFSIASAERGAHLVAVERAMARARVPACALARPGVGMRVRSLGHAGAVAAVAGAARPVELAGLDAEEAAEAEAFVGEPHRPVGIAFAGGDRVAEAGDQHVAHLRSRSPRAARCRPAARCRRWRWSGGRARRAAASPRRRSLRTAAARSRRPRTSRRS